MPVILKKTTPSNLQIGIWRILEEEEFFLQKLPMTMIEEDQLSLIKGKRRLHWLASRFLLHLLTRSTTRIECVKDEFGKPSLLHDQRHISFSHSGELVAVVIGESPCGIDIQTQVAKIDSIAHKFVRDDEEVGEDEILDLHIIWGGKEAAYKAYGRKKIDFKQHMKFSKLPDKGIQILMKKDDWIDNFEGKYELWGDYVLVYLKEK